MRGRKTAEPGSCPGSRARLHTLGDMARVLNRSAAYLSGLQVRFGLPVYEGAGYSPAYLNFLRTLVYLRTFSISEDALRDLWRIEKKLLQLLHVDSAGSPTWFLDACGLTTHRQRRLLLTNCDIGVVVPTRVLQLSLNFADRHPEFFTGKEMGEDALRVLNQYLKLRTRMLDQVADELPGVRAAGRWASVQGSSKK